MPNERKVLKDTEKYKRLGKPDREENANLNCSHLSRLNKRKYTREKERIIITVFNLSTTPWRCMEKWSIAPRLT
jgi:hypothetical protein